MDGIPAQVWEYRLLGVVAFIFASVIVMLWRESRKENKAIAKERKEHTTERAGWDAARKELDARHTHEIDKIRLEFEEKHRELVEGYANDLREDRDQSRKHEDAIREEFNELMENVSARANESSKAIVEILNKFYDRFVGPRPRY